MKASRAQVERALDAGASDVRLFLLHGPDESQSRELGQRLLKKLGASAERIDLTGGQLKGDPARLADEAAAISLFGSARLIWVEPAGDDALEAVAALIEAPVAGNPVVLIAGALRKDSKLLKLGLSEASILTYASYLPEGADLQRLASAMARAQGLQLEPDVSLILAEASGGDRATLAREIDKCALFLDAGGGRPNLVDRQTYDEISAGGGEGSVTTLVDLVLSGRPDAVAAELARLAVVGVEGIALLRPLLSRLFLLTALRSVVEDGNSVEAAMSTGGRAVFWKDKASVSSQVAHWDAPSLAKAIERVTAAELAVKASGSAGAILVDDALIVIARFARRQR